MLQLSMRLYFLSRFNPSITDIINQGERYSKGTITVAASQIVKAIALAIEDKTTGRELNSLGRELYTEGVSAMDYDDDGWCGTPPFFFHHIHNNGPAPLSLFVQSDNVNVQKEKQYYGGILNIVSQTISNQKIGNQLQQIGDKLMSRAK